MAFKSVIAIITALFMLQNVEAVRHRRFIPIGDVVVDLQKIRSGDVNTSLEGALNLAGLFPKKGKIEKLLVVVSDTSATGDAEASQSGGNS